MIRLDDKKLALWANNLIVVYAFFIPIDASVTSRIFIAILGLLLLRGNIAVSLREVWQNSVVRAFVYFVVLYCVWLIGSDDLKSGWEALKSVKNSLYLLVFMMLIDGRYRYRVLTSFLLGMMVSELLSYLIHFELVPWKFAIGGEYVYKAFAPGDPSPFLHHIHYGVLLAFSVVVLAQRVTYSHDNLKLKIVMSLFVLTASVNIFITGGRTGYIAFFPLILFFVFYYHRRWIIPSIAAITLFVAAMYQMSPILQTKVHQTWTEIQKVTQNDSDFDSSLGQRIGFWRYGMEVVKDNLWFGVGTGDSMEAVRAIIPPQDASVKSIKHEHNQYISVLLQFGIVGLAVFVHIFYRIWRFKVDDEDMRFIQLAVTLAIGIGITMTMFNLRVFLHLWILMLAVSMVSPSRRTIEGLLQPQSRFLAETVALGALFYLAVFLKEVLF